MPGGTAEPNQERFAAFISYSRRGDGRAGPLLKGALEQFPGPRYGGRRRRVFVDGRDLAASPDVWADIEAALARSGHLVLIASPEAGASSGVQREVDWWLRQRGPEKIIIVQTRGAQLAFGPDGHVLSTNVLPPALAAALTVEPNHLYLPELPTGRRIDTTDPVWADALATIVASLDNRAKSDLVGDHITNQRKSKRIRIGGSAAVAVALVLALVATYFAFRQGDEAGRQQRVATARLLLSQAEGSITADPRTALRMAEAAEYLDPGPENQTGLERLVRGTHYAGTLAGHTGNVTASAFAADGHALAAAGSDGNTILWDTHDITHPRRAGLPFSAQDESINALAWAPSNTALATADNEGTAILWDVRDIAGPRPVGTVENGSLVVSLAYAGNDILLCALRGTIKIWDVHNPAVPVPVGELRASTSPLQRMTLSANGMTLATADATGAVRVWSMADPAHPAAVGDPPPSAATLYGAISLSADGQLLAAGNADGTILIWSISRQTGVRLGTPSTDRSDPINGLAFTPDGRTLTAAHLRGPVSEWNVLTLAPLAQFTQPEGAVGQSFGALAMNPSGTVFATGRSTGEVFLWTVPDRAQPLARGAGITHPGPLDSMAVGGHTLVTVGGDTVRTWDVVDADHPRPVDALPEPDHRLHNLALAGGRVAVGSDTAEEGRVLVADLDADGRPLARGVTPPNPTHAVTAIAVRPDGQAMATGGGSGAMSLWDLADPANPRPVGPPLPGYAGQLRAATYSADGTTLVAVSDGREYRGQGIRPPGADGRGSVIAWDVVDPAHPRQLSGPLIGHDGKVRAVALSPDGRTLAYGGTSERIYLWDLSDRSTPHPIGRPLTGPTGNVSAIAFSPDGRTLAAGSWDHKVYLWDVSDLSRPVAPIGAPLAGTDNVEAVAFLPDNSALASAASDGTVTFWSLRALTESAAQALATACAATGGGFEEAEWTSRVPGLPYAATCANDDRDPAGLPGPDDVRRFGESAAVHAAVVDLAAAKQLLLNTFTDATSVTDDVTVVGQTVRARIHQVIAHPVRRKGSSDAIDKTTGAVYASPQIVVRDPAVDPPPTTPPTTYLANGTAKGIRYSAGGTDPDDVVLGLEFTPGVLANGAERTVDVYSVAFRRLADTTDVATLYHYAGSWTFGADPSGKIVLRAVQPPAEHPLSDDVALVAR